MSNDGTPQYVSFAVQVPTAVADEVERAIDAAEVRLTVREVDERPEHLRFEPLATSGLAWLVVQIFNDAGVQIALGVLGNYVYDALKKRRQEPAIATTPAHPTMTVQFDNGVILTVPLDRPVDTKEMEKIIRSRASRR
jgi:hypothetical protein